MMSIVVHAMAYLIDKKADAAYTRAWALIERSAKIGILQCHFNLYVLIPIWRDLRVFISVAPAVAPVAAPS
jgi:hypothetical protein